MAKTKPKAAQLGVPLPPGAEQLLDRRAVQRMLGIGERLFWTILGNGTFPPADLKIGALRRWRVATVNRWIEDQASKGA